MSQQFMNKNSRTLLAILMLIAIQCNSVKRDSVYAIQRTNDFEIPNEIIDDIRTRAYNECKEMIQINRKYSLSYVDSVCKHITVSRPYRNYSYRFMPLCSLTCGKPFEYYCETQFEWRVPLVVSKSDCVVISYRQTKRGRSWSKIKKSDTLWRYIGTNLEDGPNKMIDSLFHETKVTPIVISINPYHRYLFTVPGFEKSIFGQFYPWTNKDSLLAKTTIRNPCLLFDTLRALMAKDTGEFHPIKKVPNIYSDFRTLPR